jgi:hypothetical protein
LASLQAELSALFQLCELAADLAPTRTLQEIPS